MPDDDGVRLRNVSPYGDIDVPDLGQIVKARHEVVVADEDLAARLTDSGHFTAVAKPGPKTHDEAPEPTAAPAGSDSPGDASAATEPATLDGATQ